MAEIEIIECPQCGIPTRVTAAFVRERRADRRSFYCLWGHPMNYNRSTVDKLREDLALANKKIETAKQREAELADQIRMQAERAAAAERRTSAARGVATRLKNRAAAGVCPCCNRSFSQLRAHMEKQHPGFRAEEIP